MFSELSFRAHVKIFYVGLAIWIASIATLHFYYEPHHFRGRTEPTEADIGWPMVWQGYFLFAPLAFAVLGADYLKRHRAERHDSPFAFYSGLAAAFVPLLFFMVGFILAGYW
ncbi:MAG: hypothetical protein PCFJNLEI_02679 [Verrucomicrobiae bacterium]|nr:hypothetical protein [Verrucomicrobiae bacterium]